MEAQSKPNNPNHTEVIMTMLAYIDAGTGSILLQIGSVFFVSFLLFMGKIRSMIASFFERR